MYSLMVVFVVLPIGGVLGRYSIFSEYYFSIRSSFLSRLAEFDQSDPNGFEGSVLDHFHDMVEDSPNIPRFDEYYTDLKLTCRDPQPALENLTSKAFHKNDVTNMTWYTYNGIQFKDLKSPVICDTLLLSVHNEYSQPFRTRFLPWRNEYVISHNYCHLEGIFNRTGDSHWQFKIILPLVVVHYITQGQIVTRQAANNQTQVPPYGVLGVRDIQFDGQFPNLLLADIDTFITNKNMRLEDIIEKARQGTTQPTMTEDFFNSSVQPGWWKETLRTFKSVDRNPSLIDVILAKESGCFMYMWMINTGVVIMRPTETVARLLLSSIFHAGAVEPPPFDDVDQGAITFTFQHLFHFQPSLMWTMCLDRENQKWESSITGSQLLSLLQQSPFSPSYLTGATHIDDLYRHYYKKLGYPDHQTRFGTVAVTHGAWMNSRACSQLAYAVYGDINTDYWSPGHFLAHFNGCHLCDFGDKEIRQKMYDNRYMLSLPLEGEVNWTAFTESGFCDS